MKRFTIIALTLIMVLTAAGAVSAAEAVELSGEFKSELVGNSNNGKMTDAEILNLILERKFGFDADLHLDLEFKSDVHKAEVNFAEAYLNYYTKNMDWRLGKQKINWGSAYKLNPTSYFNPRDLTALKPIDEKEAVKAVKGIYYAPGRVEISGVVTPFFATHNMSEASKETSLEQLAKQTKQQTAANIYEVLAAKGLINQTINTNLTTDQINTALDFNPTEEPVKDEVDNVQGGIKVTKRAFKGFDLSASVYHGRDKLPIIDQEKVEEQVKDLITEYANSNLTSNFDKWYDTEIQDKIELDILYPQTNRIGIDVIGDIGDMGIWTEVAYSMYEDDQFDNRVETAVGVDYKFDNDLYLVGQTYYQQGRLDNEPDIKAVNLHVDKPVFDFHEVKLNAIYEAESETYLVEPQFDYSLANSTVLQLGGTYVDSEGNQGTNLISSLGDDRVYARLKVEF